MLVADEVASIPMGQLGWYRGSRTLVPAGAGVFSFQGRTGMSVVVRHASDQDISGILCLWREMMDWHAIAESRFRPLAAPEGE